MTFYDFIGMTMTFHGSTGGTSEAAGGTPVMQRDGGTRTPLYLNKFFVAFTGS